MYLAAASMKNCFVRPCPVSKLCHEVPDFNINKEDVEQLKQIGKRGDFLPTRGCFIFLPARVHGCECVGRRGWREGESGGWQQSLPLLG